MILYKRLTLLVIILIGIVAVLAILWIILQWSIAESVYSTKAGLNWFGITFYHDYSFVAAGLFALLLVYPRPGGSDLWRLVTVLFRFARPYEIEGEGRGGVGPGTRINEKMNVWLWALWQTLKWAMAFYAFVASGGFPLLGPIMNPIMMMSMGLGSWAQVPRIIALPVFPTSGAGLISLMPSMSIQYAVLSYVISAFLLVFAIRTLLRLFANLATRRSEVWIRNILALIATMLLEIAVGAPYWLMNIATPYVYGIVLSLLFLTSVGILFFSHRRVQVPRVKLLKVAAVFFATLFLVQVAAGAFYFFNWNNNYLAYSWYPQTQKQITVTRWSAGLDGIHTNNITNLPTSNPTTTLNLVRQWDQKAAAVTNTKEIGAYNWMGLASSEIVFYNHTEYWVSPTTPTFPSTDWISEHLIYTHAAKVLVINTHNGSVVPVTSAFGIASEPLIYYGEGNGFNQSVYVHVPGYDEVQNVSYTGAPDYVLNGWQKSLWFTFAEGQLGFAFSSQSMDMLWNRNIFTRVGDVLIPGLTMDPSAYIVSDGRNLYYTVQVYINYPLQSGFSASPYLRFFGVVLVNIQDGTMQGYTVSNLLGGTNSSDFITKFYQNYYSSWSAPPTWLIPQLRYPEQLLGTPSVPGQLDYDFVYHVSDPFVFRGGTQFYERAGNSTVQYIPFAVGAETYFVGMQLAQYQGVVSKNLGALYIAYGGDRLGQIDLYQNPSQSALIIGPTAAENALNTNQQVRTQLTLLPNYRFGSYLLYSVGGQLTYFVAVYTNPGSSGVVTQLPFMTSVNPSTGKVGVGPDASAAFENLGLGNSTGVTTSIDVVVKQIASLVTLKGYNLVNATSVNPTVYVNVASVSLSMIGATKTIAQVASLLQTYGPGSVGHTVYAWIDSSGNTNFGVLSVPAQGVTYMYYITIKQ